MSKLRKWMMKEERENSTGSGDTGFKLFGKTIAVSAVDSCTVKAASLDAAPCTSQEGSEEVDGAAAQAEEEGVADDRGSSLGSNCSGIEEGINTKLITVDSNQAGLEPQQTSQAQPTLEPQSVCEDSKAPPQQEMEQPEEQDGRDQTLRKPDKVVACPRCDSLDTKFCYFNNYNVNQPRHFCKNCQRYWTAGGTLRNVPVGAGRRKNKYGGLQPRQDSSEISAVATVRIDHHEPAQQMLPCSLSSLGSPVVKVPSLKIPQPTRVRVPSQCSPLPVLDSPGVSSVTSFCQDRVPKETSGSAFSLHRSVTTQQMYSSGSAFKAAGTDHTSESVTKLRQRSRTGTTESKDECGSSLTSSMAESPRDNSRVRNIRMPQHLPDAGAWTSGTTPLGFFSGAWPYGYNVGWSGMSAMPSGSSFHTPPQATVGTGPPAARAQSWSAAPGSVWTGMWAPGMPQAGMPNMPAMPFGWNMQQGSWTMPWSPMAPMAVQASTPASGNSVKKRENPESGRDDTAIQCKKSRADKVEEVTAQRSSCAV